MATSTTHGQSGNRTYNSWSMMLSRCRNPKATAYARYGGRGIAVDPVWESYEQFLADMGQRPVGKTLDRIDNNADYGPSNCRWADIGTQQRNRHNNILITFQGETLCRKDWARRLGVRENTLAYRLEHWPLEKALTPNQRAVAAIGTASPPPR